MPLPRESLVRGDEHTQTRLLAWVPGVVLLGFCLWFHCTIGSLPGKPIGVGLVGLCSMKVSLPEARGWN